MPFHDRRRWAITDIPDSAKLAELLTEYTWTCCTGFRHAGHLYLNDSTSENGAQEYAVIREADLVQIESITFGWMTADRALGYIEDVTRGFDEPLYLGRMAADRIEPAAQHKRCRHCA